MGTVLVVCTNYKKTMRTVPTVILRLYRKAVVKIYLAAVFSCLF